MLDLKEKSHKKVLSLIRMQSSVSGASLAKQTQMQPSSLVYILRHLHQKKLIRISGHGSSTQKGGKRPILWQIDENAGNILGLEILRNGLRCVLVNLAGDILIRVEKDFKPYEGEKNLERILKTIREVMREANLDHTNLLSITIAVPGIVDPKTQVIMYSSVLGLSDFDLRAYVAEAFQTPTLLINDANAGVLGEQWFNSQNPKLDNILYITLNQTARDLGLGIVLNQKLYTGYKGTAGEIISQIPSLYNIIQEGITKIPPHKILYPYRDNPERIMLSELYLYYKKECPLSIYTLRILSDYIATELSKLIGIFNPEKIVLGGDISICEELCIHEVIPKVKDFLDDHYAFKISVPQIEYARAKVFSAAIGATAFYLSSQLEHSE